MTRFIAPPVGHPRIVATHDMTGEGAPPQERGTTFPNPAIGRDRHENMVLTVLETLTLDTPRDGVAVLRLNRPERLNAINQAMRAELTHTFAALAADHAVHAVVLTGSGPRLLLRARHAQLRGRHARRPTTPPSTGCASRRRWPRCPQRSATCPNR